MQLVVMKGKKISTLMEMKREILFQFDLLGVFVKMTPKVT